MNNPRTIREILDAAGGNQAVAEAVSGLTPDAVYKWRQNGIPDRYWLTIIPMAGSSPEEIFAANEIARAEKVA